MPLCRFSLDIMYNSCPDDLTDRTLRSRISPKLPTLFAADLLGDDDAAEIVDPADNTGCFHLVHCSFKTWFHRYCLPPGKNYPTQKMAIYDDPVRCRDKIKRKACCDLTPSNGNAAVWLLCILYNLCAADLADRTLRSGGRAGDAGCGGRSRGDAIPPIRTGRQEQTKRVA